MALRWKAPLVASITGAHAAGSGIDYRRPPLKRRPILRENALEDAPTCSECGMLMVPNGACYKCENCGSTSGCS